MKAIKTVISLLVICLLAFGIYTYKDQIIGLFVDSRIYNKQNIMYSANKYYRLLNVSYVKETDDFTPHNSQDLLNIFYTVLNAGLDEFKFYCPEDEYTKCINDVKKLIEDETILSNVNNFVHPYNSYKQVFVTVNSLGEVKVKIEHTYSREDIAEIEDYVNKIINEIITPGMSDEDKIKAAHDYIINNTKYDSNYKDNMDGISHKANGLFKNHLAICGGYADAMAIFLNKFGIINYKVSSDEHVWNYVYLNGKWNHLDLTWDDPVTDTGQDIITYDYFLIDNEKLKEKDSVQHNFDTTIYAE